MLKVALISFWCVEYAIELANALADIDEVYLLIPKKYNYSKFIRSNVDTFLFHNPRLRYPTNILMVYKIAMKINEIKPDLIHVQSSSPWLNLFMKYVKKKYPLVTTIHDVKPHIGDKASKRVPFHDLIIKYSNQLIVHGEELKYQLIRKHNLKEEIINVVPHGEYSFYRNFDTKKFNEETYTILFFGRIYEYKGLRYLIEAEKYISSQIPNLKIIIAGRGDNFESYQKMITNTNNYEIYNEYINNEKISELFQRANLVVLPYIDGSQSGVLAIAYAYGKPVVVTDVGSIHEMVLDGKTGFIVPPKDSKKLAEAIIKYLKDKNLQEIMHREVIEYKKKYLVWDVIAKRTNEVYLKAVSEEFNKGKSI